MTSEKDVKCKFKDKCTDIGARCSTCSNNQSAKAKKGSFYQPVVMPDPWAQVEDYGSGERVYEGRADPSTKVRFDRNVYQTGGSVAVNIPKPIACSMKLEPGSSVSVYMSDSNELRLKKEEKKW